MAVRPTVGRKAGGGEIKRWRQFEGRRRPGSIPRVMAVGVCGSGSGSRQFAADGGYAVGNGGAGEHHGTKRGGQRLTEMVKGGQKPDLLHLVARKGRISDIWMRVPTISHQNFTSLCSLISICSSYMSPPPNTVSSIPCRINPNFFSFQSYPPFKPPTHAPHPACSTYQWCKRNYNRSLPCNQKGCKHRRPWNSVGGRFNGLFCKLYKLYSSNDLLMGRDGMMDQGWAE